MRTQAQQFGKTMRAPSPSSPASWQLLTRRSTWSTAFSIVFWAAGLCWFVQPVCAQVPNIIEVDSLSGRSRTTIPFDEPFTLKIRYDRKPDFAFAFEDKRHSSAIDLLRQKWAGLDTGKDCKKLLSKLAELRAKPSTPKRVARINEMQNASFEQNCEWDFPDKIPASRMKLEKEGGKNYLYMTFADEHDLVGPSRHLSLIIHERLPEGFRVLELWHLKKYADAKALAQEIRENQLQELGFYYLAPDSSALQTIYDAHTKSFQTIDAHNAHITAKVRSVKKHFPIPGLDSLIQAALMDTLKTIVGCLADCELEKDLLALSLMDTTEQAKLLRGERTIRDAKKISPPEARLVALRSTRDILQRILNYQRAREALTGRPASANLRDMMGPIGEVIATTEAIIRETAKIQEGLDWHYVKLKEIGGGSFVYDFNTRGALRIIPDFGMVTYGFQEGFTDIRPYLGVAFNFRQSKKNIPWGQYPKKTFWHHVSFSLGWTTASVAKEGEREDFFENGSLLAGFGWRLSDEFRLTGGTMLFYRNSPNPALDERSLACTPFIGISVDLDRKTLLNGWDKLTFKKH